MSSTSAVFKVTPTTQEYDWGRVGGTSKVAQFAAASAIPGFAIDDARPYAELWMGTHPKSPSRVASTNKILLEHLAANPSLIGQKVIDHFGAADGNLPFLFKVLSIAKALSIQTHPDKKTAEQLHLQQPDIYKDPNHKPEMALALTPFLALCGFRPLPEIAHHLRATAELAALIPPPILDQFLSLPATNASQSVTTSPGSDPMGPEAKKALRDIFSAIMTTEENVFKAQLSNLVKRYENEVGKDTGAISRDIVELVLRLNTQFPGDIGVFCAFMLNFVKLQPGEAIFLGAGEPHAYIKGDCMECMANSDNVIRAGLTPKLRDVPNLISGLTYAAAPPTKHVVQPVTDEASTLYDPPIPEFSVVQVKLGARRKEAHPAIEGPSVMIVTTGGGNILWGDGESLALRLGDVVFVGASMPVEFVASDDGNELVAYRAFVEVQ
ncbi:hypothetical protein AMATHDRAFT_78110 [Amanita thiersii Skay4041]|uniref:Mannose-6-phosphate isomerase n=1 Tax=Amanita thiersii Skay4041 TaxID=703135 RepID=A0A2A9N7U8_9AGAR|nr:hypothetical protein AMATHDRAFT_78110 [Amanita thiersii Skay4041]